MTKNVYYYLWKLFALLPIRLLYAFSDVMYFVMRYLLKYRIEVIQKNIRESFPEKTEAQQKEIIKGFYHWFCDYFVETLKLMTLSPQALQQRMTFSGVEVLESYIAQGRSCAFYLGHYGQWEWISSFPLWIGKEAQCLQIYHPLRNQDIDRLMLEVRERNGAICVPMDATLRRVVEYQKIGRPIIMGYIADQVPNWRSIHHWVDFLHHDSPVFTGSERIIRRANQVAFYLDISRTKRGYYHCELKLLTDDPQSLPDFDLTNRYFSLLEHTIRRDPSLYLWSHNRWKRTRQEYNLRRDPETGFIDTGPIEGIIARKALSKH